MADDFAGLSADKHTLKVLINYQEQCLRVSKCLTKDDLSPAMRQFWHERVEYYEKARTEWLLQLAHSLKDAGTVRADFISKL